MAAAVGSRFREEISENKPKVVGTGRFELPTCRLGGDRSIHLSYVPAVFIVALPARRLPDEDCEGRRQFERLTS